MPVRKNLRELEAEMLRRDKALHAAEQSDAAVIDVKIQSKEQLFSAYSYSGDRLNPEFCDYLFDNAKHAPIGEALTIRIRTHEDVCAEEVDRTLKNHYSGEYRAAKNEWRRLGVISLIMTILGVIALAVMVLVNHFFDNFYVNTIIEIAAWVFIWEAVDYFFLQRPVAKGKCLLLQRLYAAKTEIDKTE